MGKLPNNELKKLLSCIKPDDRVLIPPLIGYDAGVHRIGDKYVAVASDPCTGVPEEWFGWLLINYAASDVALLGAKPEFCTVTLLAPKDTKSQVFLEIMEQTCKAANELSIAIVRGHTGMYESVNSVIGVATVYGTVEKEKLVTPKSIKDGDLILCTKPLGLESVSNFSISYRETAQKLFGEAQQKRLSKQVQMQGCVKEALELARIEGVHALHDATEGGLVAALNELSEACQLGFSVGWESVTFPDELLVLQRHFGFSDEQLLAVSSTGTIVAAIKPSAQQKVKTLLEKMGLSPFVIGTFTKKPERIIQRNRVKMNFPRVADDPYSNIFSGK